MKKYQVYFKNNDSIILNLDDEVNFRANARSGSFTFQQLESEGEMTANKVIKFKRYLAMSEIAAIVPWVKGMEHNFLIQLKTGVYAKLTATSFGIGSNRITFFDEKGDFIPDVYVNKDEVVAIYES